MNVQRFMHTLLRMILLLTLLAAGLNTSHVQAASVQRQALGMSQFTNAGHVLAFGEGEVYLAGLDHALHIQFVEGLLDKPVTSTMSGAAPGQTSLEKAAYANVWPHVNVSYTSAPGVVAESTYTVNPGGDVNDIRLQYNVPVELTSDGILRFAFENGEMTENAPIAWQVIGNERHPVEVAFRILGPQQVGFSVGTYLPQWPLIIDPAYYWHTFYGSDAEDFGLGIAVAPDGSVYTVGTSFATWNGPDDRTPLHPYRGNSDIVIVKLDAAGSYQWHTFYGSSLPDTGSAIATDSANNIYILGTSQQGWNGNGGHGPENPHSGSGSDNLVILKLSSNGSYYWHTFYPGSTVDVNGDRSAGVVVDGSFNIFVVATSNVDWDGPANLSELSTENSPEAPLSTESVDGPEPINPYMGGDDIVTLRLQSDGSYAWHAFYGSASDDSGRGITLDPDGRMFLIGDSDATWTEKSGNAPLNAHSGSRDIVVIKLGKAGGFWWHTFWGSASDDFGYGIATDPSRNIYLAGSSADTWGSPGDPFAAGGTDVVVIKLDNFGVLQWHVFHGSASDDHAYGLWVGANGYLYVTGTSAANWAVGGRTTGVLDSYVGGEDILLLKLKTNGAYQLHTFYGGSDNDDGQSVAVDTNGKIFIAGSSAASWDGAAGKSPLHSASDLSEIAVVATRAVNLAVFRSAGANDGWVRELSQGSGTGGTKNSANTTLLVGDDATNLQYRDILHFNTGGLPDNAVLLSSMVRTKFQGLVGTDPFTDHGSLVLDIRTTYFGTTPNLENIDFNAAPGRANVGTFNPITVGGWQQARVLPVGLQYISRTNTTQFRMRFTIANDGDNVADYLTFTSGNDLTVNVPLLEVWYYIP